MIDKNQIKESYEGEPDEVYKYEITDRSCDSTYYSAAKTDLEFLRKYTEDGEYCYEITGVGPGTLAIRYTGNGKALVFKRRS